MNTASTSTITRLLRAWSGGDAQAGEQLLLLVYEELRRRARRYLRRERRDHTLDPTAYQATIELQEPLSAADPANAGVNAALDRARKELTRLSERGR